MRPNQECPIHLRFIYSPFVGKGTVTADEFASLQRAVANNGYVWTRISEVVGRPRETRQALWRYWIEKEENKGGKWTAEEILNLWDEIA